MILAAMKPKKDSNEQRWKIESEKSDFMHSQLYALYRRSIDEP